MFSFGLLPNQVMTVDLHQMDAKQAKDFLYAKVTKAPKTVREIEVVHGFHGGTALQNMVRKSFKHPRVEKIVLGLNQGSTILILKP